MALDSHWSSNIGFRHVVEDGLSILKGEALDDERRSYVLKELAERFESAKRGFEMAEQAKFFFGKADQAANASSSMMRQYLRSWQDGRLHGDVSAAHRALASACEGAKPAASSVDVKAAIILLDALVKALKQDAQRRIPFAPLEVRIRG